MAGDSDDRPSASSDGVTDTTTVTTAATITTTDSTLPTTQTSVTDIWILTSTATTTDTITTTATDSSFSMTLVSAYPAATTYNSDLINTRDSTSTALVDTWSTDVLFKSTDISLAVTDSPDAFLTTNTEGTATADITSGGFTTYFLSTSVGEESTVAGAEPTNTVTVDTLTAVFTAVRSVSGSDTLPAGPSTDIARPSSATSDMADIPLGPVTTTSDTLASFTCNPSRNYSTDLTTSCGSDYRRPVSDSVTPPTDPTSTSDSNGSNFFGTSTNDLIANTPLSADDTTTTTGVTKVPETNTSTDRPSSGNSPSSALAPNNPAGNAPPAEKADSSSADVPPKASADILPPNVLPSDVSLPDVPSPDGPPPDGPPADPPPPDKPLLELPPSGELYPNTQPPDGRPDDPSRDTPSPEVSDVLPPDLPSPNVLFGPDIAPAEQLLPDLIDTTPLTSSDILASLPAPAKEGYDTSDQSSSNLSQSEPPGDLAPVDFSFPSAEETNSFQPESDPGPDTKQASGSVTFVESGVTPDFFDRPVTPGSNSVEPGRDSGLAGQEIGENSEEKPKETYSPTTDQESGPVSTSEVEDSRVGLSPSETQKEEVLSGRTSDAGGPSEELVSTENKEKADEDKGKE